MKHLALAVLLTVVQTSPPIARQADNGTASTHQSVQNRATNNGAPSTQSAPSVTANETPKRDAGSDQPAEKEKKTDEVNVTKLPVVSVEPDYGMWVFSGLLVLVGLIQAFLLYRTWGQIERQAGIMGEQAGEMTRQRIEMAAQRDVMSGQLDTMQRQVSEMESQTETLKKSVEAANKSADAARENVQLMISKERPRISMDDPEKLLFPSSGPCRVEYKLRFSGLITAYILESVAIAGISDSREALPTDTVMTPPVVGLPSEVTPTTTQVHGTSAYFLPNITVSKATVDEIVMGKKFAHFWGFIRFRDASCDVFHIERKLKFHYTWRYTTFPQIGGRPNDPPFGLWDGKCEEEETKAD